MSAQRRPQDRRVEDLAKEHGEALLAVLPDLPAGQDAALLHLLLCPLCGAGALLRLKDEVDDDAEGPDYSPVWERIKERLPRLLEQANERFAEAEQLLDDLLGCPPNQRAKALNEPRFQSRYLLNLLLERSRAAQPLDPRQAEALASLAGAETVDQEPWVTDEREQTRLLWLEGQVHARLGEPENAEPLLETARRRFIAEYRLPEVALCSLDLAVLLVATGQVAEAAFTLRRVFRFRGYRVEPLPFV